MSAREIDGDVIEVQAREIRDVEADPASVTRVMAAAAATLTEPPELQLLPTVVAKTEIERANPALQQMAYLRNLIDLELPTLDVNTKDGEKRMRELRARCVKLRTSTDEAYESWNKPVLEAQRGIRAIVKQVAEGIASHEQNLDKAIKAKEAVAEVEKARKLAEEQARIAALRSKITDIASMPAAAVKMTSATLEAAIKQLRALEITDNEASFGEFSDEAAALRDNVATELQSMLDTKRAAAAEALLLEAARAAQAEERRQLDAQAAEQAALRAEQGRQLAAQRAEIAAQAAELQRQRDEIAAAEAKRKADEEARIAAAAAEEQRQRDAEAAAESARLAVIEAEAAAKRERDDRIESRIKALRASIVGSSGQSSAELSVLLEKIQSTPIDVDSFGDRVTEAQEAKDEAVTYVTNAYHAARDREIEAAEAERQAEAHREHLAREAEAAEARALDSEAETFDDIARVVVDSLALADYPSAECGSREILTLLTHPKVQAAMAARLKALA